ncbi:hypothetical protein RP20_CCG009371 [Aedes albopictus]|nr:hypothetical protein RP20_CCG009371 [Aedes albopictus]
MPQEDGYWTRPGVLRVHPLAYISCREKLPGSFEIVHAKDATGHFFNSRLIIIFIIGKATKAFISLPKCKGVNLSIAEERDK